MNNTNNNITQTTQMKMHNTNKTNKKHTEKTKQKQGQIHGYPSRVRVGSSSAGEDQPTYRPTDRHSGV